MYIRELTSEEFNNFKDRFDDKSVYQTSEYAYIMSHQNYTTMLLGLTDGSNILAATMIMIQKRNNFKYAYAPRGFLIDYKDYALLEAFTSELKNYLSKQEVVAVKLSPMIIKNIYDNKGNLLKTNDNFNIIFDNLKSLEYHHFGYNNFFEGHKPRFEAILDINKNYLTLFRNIRKEFKTKIRSSEVKGVRIIKGTLDDLDYLIKQVNKKYPRGDAYFKDVYKYFSQRDMIDYYYAKLDTKIHLETIKKRYEQEENNNNLLNSSIMNNTNNSSKLITKKIQSDNLLIKAKNELIKATNLLRDYPEGIILASVLVIRIKDEIYLYMDGFDNKYKKLNAKHLIIWKLIEKYSKLGFKTFNLGGMTNITVENNRYAGLNEFKLGFNSNIYEYIGDFELICNNTFYFMYKKSMDLRKMLGK